MLDESVQPFRKCKPIGDQEQSADNDAAHTPVFQEDNRDTFKDLKRQNNEGKLSTDRRMSDMAAK